MSLTLKDLIKNKQAYYKYFSEIDSLKAVEKNGYALQYVKDQT
jgi:hypothetical protein